MDRRKFLRSAALAFAGAGAMTLGAGAAVADGPGPAPVIGNVNELVVRYIAAWNERDAERRRDLIAKTWTADGTYIDAHRRGIGQGMHVLDAETVADTQTLETPLQRVVEERSESSGIRNVIEQVLRAQ